MLEPLPYLRAPVPPEDHLARGLPPRVALDCLAAGWRDFRQNPMASLAYGVLIFLVSIGVVWILEWFQLLYLVFPAFAGFMLMGPFFAIGLYQKSRALSEGHESHLADMRRSHAAAGAQLAYAGLLLCLLLLFWLRAADLLYALFFGLQPFPGAAEAVVNTFTTVRGWALLVTGGLVGGLFASFAFAISLYSIPMLVSEPYDALTAFGRSFAMVTRNLGPSVAWGAIVTVGFFLCFATGLIGLIVIFPVLGHGTWHMYRRMRPDGAR